MILSQLSFVKHIFDNYGVSRRTLCFYNKNNTGFLFYTLNIVPTHLFPHAVISVIYCTLNCCLVSLLLICPYIGLDNL